MDASIFIRAIFRILDLLILARILLSFFPMDRYNPIVRFIYETTEFVLGPIRRIMPNTGMIDFSPMIAWFLLHLVEKFLYQIF